MTFTKLRKGAIALLAATGIFSLAAASTSPKSISSAPIRVELIVPDSVVPQFVSLAKESWQNKTESMRCVEKYRVEKTNDSSYQIVIEKLGEASEVVGADSISIYVQSNPFGLPVICGDTLPIVHTHLPSNGRWYPRPSSLDVLILRQREKIDFGIIVAIKDSHSFGLVLYGAKDDGN